MPLRTSGVRQRVHCLRAMQRRWDSPIPTLHAISGEVRPHLRLDRPPPPQRRLARRFWGASSVSSRLCRPALRAWRPHHRKLRLVKHTTWSWVVSTTRPSALKRSCAEMRGCVGSRTARMSAPGSEDTHTAAAPRQKMARTVRAASTAEAARTAKPLPTAPAPPTTAPSSAGSPSTALGSPTPPAATGPPPSHAAGASPAAAPQGPSHPACTPR